MTATVRHIQRWMRQVKLSRRRVVDDISWPVSERTVIAVSYTHLDVYKRQAL